MWPIWAAGEVVGQGRGGGGRPGAAGRAGSTATRSSRSSRSRAGAGRARPGVPAGSAVSHDGRFTRFGIRVGSSVAGSHAGGGGGGTAVPPGRDREFLGHSPFRTNSPPGRLWRVGCRWTERLSVVGPSGPTRSAPRPRPPLAGPRAHPYTATGPEAGRLPRLTRRGPTEAAPRSTRRSRTTASSTPHTARPHGSRLAEWGKIEKPDVSHASHGVAPASAAPASAAPAASSTGPEKGT